MLLTRNSGGYEFNNNHLWALCNLVRDRGFTVTAALAEIAGLSSAQANEIEKGLDVSSSPLPTVVTPALPAAAEEPVIDIPPEFICPITGKIMNDPVYDTDPSEKESARFERSALEEMLAGSVAKTIFEVFEIKADDDLRNRIEGFKKQLSSRFNFR